MPRKKSTHGAAETEAPAARRQPTSANTQMAATLAFNAHVSGNAAPRRYVIGRSKSGCRVVCRFVFRSFGPTRRGKGEAVSSMTSLERCEQQLASPHLPPQASSSQAKAKARRGRLWGASTCLQQQSCHQTSHCIASVFRKRTCMLRTLNIEYREFI